MLGKFVNGRVCVFIDAANILYSQKTLGWKMDYTKLKTYLEHECDLKGMYFYTGHVGDNKKQQSFLNKLRNLGYCVRAKEVKRIRVSPDTYLLKGNLDVELTIDVMKNVQEFDTMVLMSGDSDFASLLDEVKQQQKRVIVLSARDHVAVELLRRAKYIALQKLQKMLSFEESKKSPPPKRGEV